MRGRTHVLAMRVPPCGRLAVHVGVLLGCCTRVRWRVCRDHACTRVWLYAVCWSAACMCLLHTETAWLHMCWQYVCVCTYVSARVLSPLRGGVHAERLPRLCVCTRACVCMEGQRAAWMCVCVLVCTHVCAHMRLGASGCVTHVCWYRVCAHVLVPVLIRCVCVCMATYVCAWLHVCAGTLCAYRSPLNVCSHTHVCIHTAILCMYVAAHMCVYIQAFSVCV